MTAEFEVALTAAFLLWIAVRRRRAREAQRRRDQFRYLLGVKPWWGQR